MKTQQKDAEHPSEKHGATLAGTITPTNSKENGLPRKEPMAKTQTIGIVRKDSEKAQAIGMVRKDPEKG